MTVELVGLHGFMDSWIHARGVLGKGDGWIFDRVKSTTFIHMEFLGS